MAPVSNANLLVKITALEAKISELSIIIINQSKTIENQNAIILNKVENLENKIIKLNNNISLNSDSTNTTDLVFTDVENIDIDYSDKDIFCNKIKDRLNIDIKIEEIEIERFKYKDDTKKQNKYSLKFSNIDTVKTILNKRKLLKNTNLYINEKVSKLNNNIFYHTRKLKQKKLIKSTWIYKSNIYIKDNNNDSLHITNLKQLDSIL